MIPKNLNKWVYFPTERWGIVGNYLLRTGSFICKGFWEIFVKWILELFKNLVPIR